GRVGRHRDDGGDARLLGGVQGVVHQLLDDDEGPLLGVVARLRDQRLLGEEVQFPRGAERRSFQPVAVARGAVRGGGGAFAFGLTDRRGVHKLVAFLSFKGGGHLGAGCPPSFCQWPAWARSPFSSSLSSQSRAFDGGACRRATSSRSRGALTAGL